jgi:hypothetical protein
LHQGDAADAVGDPGDIEDLQDLVDAGLRAPQQVSLALPQLHLARGHRAGADFILQTPNEIVQAAVLPVAGEQEEGQSADGAGGALRPGGDHGQLRPGVAGEILLPRQPPVSAFRPGDGLHGCPQIRAAAGLGHPGGALPDLAVPPEQRWEEARLKRGIAVFAQGQGSGQRDGVGAVKACVIEGCYISDEERRGEPFPFEGPPDRAGPVALQKHPPVIRRVEDLIDAVAEAVVSAQPRRAHAIDHRGDGLPLRLPPSLQLLELSPDGKRNPHCLKEPRGRRQGFHELDLSHADPPVEDPPP